MHFNFPDSAIIHAHELAIEHNKVFAVWYDGKSYTYFVAEDIHDYSKQYDRIWTCYGKPGETLLYSEEYGREL